MGIASTRDIAPGGLHRNQALPGDESRRKFCLKLSHALKLRLRKLFNPFIGELNIVPGALRQAFASGFDLVRRDDDVSRPFVEMGGIFARFVFATGFDFGQHGLYRLARLFFAGGGRLLSSLQVNHV